RRTGGQPVATPASAAPAPRVRAGARMDAPGPPILPAAAAPGPDPVVGLVDLGRAALRLFKQLGRGAGHAVGMVLGHQPAIGEVDLGLAGLRTQAEDAPGIVARAPEPVAVECVPDQQADEAAGRVPHQQPTGDEPEQFSIPSLHAADSSVTGRANTAHRYNARPTAAIRPMATTLLEARLPGFELLHRGKVRDVYALPPGSGPEESGPLLLMVATDRLSAFDVVLPDPIPGKGEMLCQVSNFWFERTEHLVQNHLTGIDVASVLPPGVEPAPYRLRSVVTRRLKPVPVEAIARGYLIGSGWKDYQRTGRVSGIPLPDGLRQAEKLPQPIFTPSTKAAAGDHDENIDFDTMVRTIGAELAEQVRDATLRLYAFAAEYAAERGIILADTKFEFGTDADGRLYVMDEMLTPDS